MPCRVMMREVIFLDKKFANLIIFKSLSGLNTLTLVLPCLVANSKRSLAMINIHGSITLCSEEPACDTEDLPLRLDTCTLPEIVPLPSICKFNYFLIISRHRPKTALRYVRSGFCCKKVTFRNVPTFTNRSVCFLLVNIGKQTGMDQIERLHFLAPGTGAREGGEKTQPFNRFPSHRVTFQT